jgi:GntR family phosphonate transport system transcriptional regulator
MANLDHNSAEALYSQIRRSLLDDIRERYQAGAYLPPEQTLASRFGVNRHTVRRAIDELVEEGILERQHGRGTLVLNAPIEYPIGKGSRFTETFSAIGTASSLVLRKELIDARGGVAEKLGLHTGAPVLWIETLRLLDERPLCLISHFLPQHYAELTLERYREGSLHSFLAEHFALRLRRSYSLVTALMPRGNDAQLLQMSQRQPVLRVKSLNVQDPGDEPVEYAVTRFRADAVQLRINP